METGFLNFHDEHFSTSVYDQSNGFESENSLFGGFMADYSGHFDSGLQLTSEPEFNRLNDGESSPNKSEEDFHQTFLDWQQHISTLQERDDDKSDLLCQPVSSSMPDIFAPCTQIEDDIKSVSAIADDVFSALPEDKNNETRLTVEDILNAVKTEVESPIKVEDEDCFNVDAIPETMPVLEAEDLTTLLEQFEASEAVKEKTSPAILPLPVIEPIKIASPPKAQIKKKITEALPKEVINRINESSKWKKGISLVPAARMPPSWSGTRMKGAGATFSRNKFLSIVTGSINGESVQLDHDYCTNSNNTNDITHSIRFYKSEPTDYEKKEDCSMTKKGDKWENSKKDSGLESGEMSDASEGSFEKIMPNIANDTGKVKCHEKTMRSLKVEHYNEPMVSILKPLTEIKKEVIEIEVNQEYIVNNVVKVELNEKSMWPIKIEPSHRNESMVSILKPLVEIKKEIITDELHEKGRTSVFDIASVKEEVIEEVKQEQKKKKLNLEEYRKRRKNMKISDENYSNNPGHLDAKTLNDEAGSEKERCMVNAEVQTRDTETKKPDEETNKSRGRSRSRKRYRSRRYSSSSSSNVDSRIRCGKRRGRSRRRHSRTRGQRSIWSRSRSRSNSSSFSSSSSLSSHSRSRSRSRSSKWRNRSHSYKRNSSYNRRSRYTPPRGAKRQEDWNPKEKKRQVEERRVIYVGQIEEGTTKTQLRERFQSFGPIIDISLHFRERGDNYGFVTFAYKVDAYEAVEHGNDNPSEPRYDICFGGRRAFCQQRYADLDGLSTQEFSPGPYQQHHARTSNSFDILLREAQDNIRKRSSV